MCILPSAHRLQARGAEEAAAPMACGQKTAPEGSLSLWRESQQKLKATRNQMKSVVFCSPDKNYREEKEQGGDGRLQREGRCAREEKGVPSGGGALWVSLGL